MVGGMQTRQMRQTRHTMTPDYLLADEVPDSLKEFLDIDLRDYYFRILHNLSRQLDYVLLPFLVCIHRKIQYKLPHNGLSNLVSCILSLPLLFLNHPRCGCSWTL